MPKNINVNPTSSNANRRKQMAAYYNGAGRGSLLTATPYSNSVNVGPTTVLADFTPAVYTGAAPQSFVPGAPYLDAASGVNRVSGGSLTFRGTDGQAQTLSNVAVGPITMAGSLDVIVTAAGMAGTPRTVTVPVLTTDSNADIAEKIEEALIADADVGPFFNVTTVGNKVYLTRKVAAANDATMNVSFATGTATGLTAEPTATQVLPGAAPGSFTPGAIQGVFLTDLDGALVDAFPFAQSYAIDAPDTAVTVDMDIPYGS